MPDLTRDPVTFQYTDRSTVNAFSFGFLCGLCGAEWRSQTYAFNPGSLSPPIDPTLYQMLWSEQHRAAYERAKRDVSFGFNHCPMCGRWVCKNCFYLSETGLSDICADCLNENVIKEEL